MCPDEVGVTKGETAGTSRRSRGVKTPLFPQSERTECAAACLASVLAYYGRWVPMSELRITCRVGRDGCTGADLLRAARTYGLEAKGWSRQIKNLHKSTLPAIVFWEFKHFVVLEDIGRKRVRMNDPSSGRLVVDYDTFDKGFTGIILEFAVGPDFQKNEKPPGPIWQLWQWLRDFKPALLLATLSGLMLAAAYLAFPLMLSVLVDHVLIGGQASWGGAIIVLMFMIAALTYLLAWMHAVALRRIAVGIALTKSDEFVSHLLRLPFAFYTHRLVGDLVNRSQLLDRLSDEGAAAMVRVGVEAVMCLAFLAAVFFFDPILGAVALALALIWWLIVSRISDTRTELNHMFAREQGLLYGLIMSAMRSRAAIRATATDDSLFARWGGYQAREVTARQAFHELGHVVQALPVLFIMIGSALVLGVGGWRVSTGELSIGGLMGVFILTTNFLRPVGALTIFLNELQSKAADMFRLEDITGTPATGPHIGMVRGEDEPLPTIDGRLRLTGEVELRNVTFGFTPGKEPLIEDFSLSIGPGQRVAVVGPTGSGKSTLALLVSGMHQPWSGEILYDGRRLDEIPWEVFTESVGIVEQGFMLFAASVWDNLTFWNPTVADDAVMRAARDADIHEEIMSRPGGYQSLITEQGQNFSGGQRQRLEIARALINDPSVLIMDEATSSLDAVTEERIDRNLRRRGCSCLIIAHRLSTIRDCDQIIVLDGGKEVQRGNHDELIALDGPYRKLIIAE